jgi:hypothetical protein
MSRYQPSAEARPVTSGDSCRPPSGLPAGHDGRTVDGGRSRRIIRASRRRIPGAVRLPPRCFAQAHRALDPTVKAELTGPGMCAFFGPDGVPNKKAFDKGTSIIEDYETEQARVCAMVPNCGTDDGARAGYVDRLENFSSDWNHLNVRGQAEVAEITGPAAAALFELT